MTRVQRAIQFAKDQVIAGHPAMANKAYREQVWKEATPFEKFIFIQGMVNTADYDLQQIEELHEDI